MFVRIVRRLQLRWLARRLRYDLPVLLAPPESTTPTPTPLDCDADDARRRAHFSVSDVSVDSKFTDSFMFMLVLYVRYVLNDLHSPQHFRSV